MWLQRRLANCVPRVVSLPQARARRPILSYKRDVPMPKNKSRCWSFYSNRVGRRVGLSCRRWLNKEIPNGPDLFEKIRSRVRLRMNSLVRRSNRCRIWPNVFCVQPSRSLGKKTLSWSSKMLLWSHYQVLREYRSADSNLSTRILKTASKIKKRGIGTSLSFSDSTFSISDPYCEP